MSIFNTIICRYNEIATKGNNRGMFETKLSDNIRMFCNEVCKVKAQRIRGRIFLHKADGSVFSDEETEKKYIEKLFERKHEEIEQMIQKLKELQDNLNKDLKIFRKTI